VRAAERAVAQQSALIGVAATELFPSFSIDGSFNWSADQLPNLFTGRAFGGIIGPSFNWKLLNYGRLQNNVRAYEAQFQKAAIDYQQTVLKANKEVEDALIAFLKSQERADRLRGAVEATERSVELAVAQYREGAVDFERIFNLQNVLVRQQLDLARARADISLSLIEIYRALRGGWQIRLEPPSVAMPVALPPVEQVRTPGAEGNRRPVTPENLPPLPEEMGPPQPNAEPAPAAPAPDAVPAGPSDAGQAGARRSQEISSRPSGGIWRKKS
jgi:hypothetical protein